MHQHAQKCLFSFSKFTLIFQTKDQTVWTAGTFIPPSLFSVISYNSSTKIVNRTMEEHQTEQIGTLSAAQTHCFASLREDESVRNMENPTPLKC